MRRIFEWIGGFALIAFSFYFTDKVSLLVASKSELMQEIEAVSSIYETKPENAKIDKKESTIVPGRFGRTVNSQESYLEMHDFGTFNENYLVFDYIKPENSLEDNKDKFITSGNPTFRRISLVVDNPDIAKYLDGKNIPYNVILDKFSSVPSNVEVINGGKDKSTFKEIDSKVKNSAKICHKERSQIDLCKKNGYYLIETKLVLMQSNLIEIKNSASSGSIILISSGAKLEDVKHFLNEIEYKDLEIVKISKLISEKESA
ncbi:MAG TPA: hypothetical protein DCY94_00635 [Firmicutes bacterium]|nr:hypothetical protein [Bacillota bacterium]